MSAPKDEKDLTEAFYNFDRDQDGLIAIDELRDLLMSDGLNMSAAELDEMMREANRGDGFCDYRAFSSFLMMSIAE